MRLIAVVTINSWDKRFGKDDWQWNQEFQDGNEHLERIRTNCEIWMCVELPFLLILWHSRSDCEEEVLKKGLWLDYKVVEQGQKDVLGSESWHNRPKRHISFRNNRWRLDSLGVLWQYKLIEGAQVQRKEIAATGAHKQWESLVKVKDRVYGSRRSDW